MSIVKEVKELADAMELKGAERREFILSETRRKEEEKRLEAEREAERKRLEAEREAEQKRLEAEREEKRLEAEREEKRLEAERKFELEKLRIQSSQPSTSTTSVSRPIQGPKQPKLPAFIDGKDDLESWMLRFEKFATANNWPKESWAVSMSALLTGTALETYCRLSEEEMNDYNAVKEALQKRYNLTEEGYRQKFRRSKPEVGENPAMFVVRLKNYLSRWISLSKTPETFVGMRDLIVKEQFMDACTSDLTTHLRERSFTTLDETTMVADMFLVARKRQLSDRMPEAAKREDKQEYKAEVQRNVSNVCLICKKPGHRQAVCRFNQHENQRRRCYRCQSEGHMARNCPVQVVPRTESKKVAAAAVMMGAERTAPMRNVAVMGTREERLPGVMAVETTDAERTAPTKGVAVTGTGEETLPGVKDGLLQLADGSTIQVISSCGACSDMRPVEDLRLPVEKGLVGDKVVNVLRDTGCECVVVRRGLVDDSQLTGERCLITRIDNTKLLAEKAVIDVSTPYLHGKVEALCIPQAVCDLIVGNVSGARGPDDPDLSLVVGAASTRSRAKDEMKPLNVPKIDDHFTVDRKKLIELQQSDDKIKNLIGKKMMLGRKGKTVSFEKKNGIIYRIYDNSSCKHGAVLRQVVLPKSLRNHVMTVAHDSIVGGHLGIRKTKERVMSNFYWPGLEGDITRYCRSCDICQRTTKKTALHRAPLQNIPVVDVPFKRVAIDIIGPLDPPSEAGHRYILTLIDYATRYPEAIPLKRIDTETVAEALVDIYSRLGIPEEILSDQGQQFVSNCMKEVCRLLGIKRSTTTPFHPSCNGLVENFNKSLKTMLRRLCREQPKQWHRYINALLFAYREVPQESTKFAPFELLYGRSVRGPMEILRQIWTKDIGESDVKTSYQYVLELRERLDDTLKIAQEELCKAQRRQKFYYDRKARVRKFKPGDSVLVLLPTESNKLLMQWKGPYDIVSVVGLNDYKVNMKGKIKTIHVNLLKQYIVREADVDEEKIKDDNAKQSPNVGSVAVIDDLDDDVVGSCMDDLPEVRAGKCSGSVRDLKIGEQLSQGQKEELEGLVKGYESIFSDLPGRTKSVEHCIELTSDIPVRQKSYPIPYALRKELNSELKEMERMGIIRKSSSPYASPIVVVKKKDGSNRICVDYRRLNKITKFDPEPMKPTADIFQGMSDDKFFTKIDLSKGYWQIPVRDEDIPKTAFVSPDAHYEFLRMPFGMMNSGATLIRVMKEILDGMDDVVSYVDDLLVHSKTWDNHLETLKELFARLKRAGLTVKPQKCVLGAAEIDFLGHHLGVGSVSLQDDNVRKIRDASRPVSKKDVRAFIGLVGYYRNFIPNFAAVSAPLTDLTKKGKPNLVEWGEPQERAYEYLKKAVSSKPILQMPDMNNPFIVRTDASDVGIGATLLQESNGCLMPIAYSSRKLIEREKRYSTSEKECLAIVFGIKKFALYLYGNKFTLQTDHQPLQYLNAAKFESPRVMRWALFLQNYNFTVQYIKGCENVGADFLSRVC